MKKLLYVLLTACALGLHAPSTFADDLQAIKLKIEVEEGKLSQLRKDRSSLGASLQKLKLEQQKLEKDKKDQTQELAKTERELKALELSQGETDREIVEEAVTLEGSLVELYKIQKRKRGLSILFNANSSLDLLKRGHQLGVIAAYGDDVLRRLSLLREELIGEKLKFEELLLKRRADLEQLRKTGLALEQRKKESSILFEQSQQKEKEQKAILKGLSEQAKQIEQAIASVTGESEEKTEKQVAEGYEGSGLESQRGKLTFPVSGKLLQSFGKAQHEEFSDLIVVKGLEVSADVGSKVYPVAPGKIVLAQIIPGFGNVVIVDHGARFYSLYGRLATTLGQVGTVVSRRDAVGLTGELDFKGRNFYFELRVKGKAVDPKPYFGNLPG